MIACVGSGASDAARRKISKKSEDPNLSIRLPTVDRNFAILGIGSEQEFGVLAE